MRYTRTRVPDARKPGLLHTSQRRRKICWSVMQLTQQRRLPFRPERKKTCPPVSHTRQCPTRPHPPWPLNVVHLSSYIKQKCAFISLAEPVPTGVADVNIEHMGCGCSAPVAGAEGTFFSLGTETRHADESWAPRRDPKHVRRICASGPGDHRAAYGATLGAT